MLEYNLKEDMMFLRIGSDVVPFASHEVNKFNWVEHFKPQLTDIGNFIKSNNFRISMHPDQFILINALKEDIVNKSIKELEYQCLLLDTMGLDKTAKLQIHVGGAYGDKTEAIKRFISSYKNLPENLKNRLVIENDDRIFSLKDCMGIFEETGIPIIYDNFHNECNNNGENNTEAAQLFKKTWKPEDGLPMVDYSSQSLGERKGKHTEHIDIEHFAKFLFETKDVDFDIMLEIKDKESSAKEAISAAKVLGRIT